MTIFAILSGAAVMGVLFMMRAFNALSRDIDRENDQGWS